MRRRAVSAPLSASVKSATAAWPLRSSGTAQRPQRAPLRRPQPADRRALQHDRAVCRPSDLAAQRLHQFVLAVAGDAGDAENFAGAHARS